MEYNGFVADYLFNLIVVGMWVAFLWRVLDGLRFSVILTVILTVLIHSVCFYLEIYIVPPSLLRALMMPVEPFICALVLVRGTVLRKVFAVLVVCVLSCVAEMPFSPYSKGLQHNDLINTWADPMSVTLGIMLIPLLALILFLASTFFTKSKRVLKGKSLFVFTMFPLLQFICVACIESLVLDSSKSVYVPIVVIVSFALIIADIALFQTMVQAEERAQLEITNQLLSKQLGNQLSHYNALTEQYESIREIRHDIYHHLNTIKILISEGKTAEASKYAEELIPMQRYITRMGECENHIVDAFLYNRIKDAESKGIAVKSEIAIPASLSVADTDLIGLFGNIMDNAIEACKDMDNAEISIKAHISKGYLIVNESNPISDAPVMKERRIPELERGIGFRILEDISKRYDGTFEHGINGNRFEVTVILKVKVH